MKYLAIALYALIGSCVLSFSIINQAQDGANAEQKIDQKISAMKDDLKTFTTIQESIKQYRAEIETARIVTSNMLAELTAMRAEANVMRKEISELKAEIKRLQDGTVVPPDPTTLKPLDAKLPSRMYESPDHIWFADVRKFPTHPKSDLWVHAGISISLPNGEFNSGSSIYPGIRLDSGPAGETYKEPGKPAITLGTPINAYDEASRSLWKVPKFGVHPFDIFDDWHANYIKESYTGPTPFGIGHRIQNVPPGLESDKTYSGMDRHSLAVILKGGKPYQLHEYYRAWKTDSGELLTSNGAKFELTGELQYVLWPDGWTSSNAAGTQFTQLMVRRSEIADGRIGHMLGMTAAKTDRSYVWPATHHAGNFVRPQGDIMPMGTIVRSKINSTILQSRINNYTLTKGQRAIVDALHQHGAIIMDNGMRGWIAGEEGAMPMLDIKILEEHFKTSDLEVVDASRAMLSPTSSRIKSEFVLSQ